MKTGSRQRSAGTGDLAATVGNRRLREIPAADAAWWAAVVAYGPDHPALVGSAAIAQATGRSPATVRWWRWTGNFPAPVIVGGHLRHLRSDVAGWLVGRGRCAAALAAVPRASSR